MSEWATNFLPNPVLPVAPRLLWPVLGFNWVKPAQSDHFGKGTLQPQIVQDTVWVNRKASSSLCCNFTCKISTLLHALQPISHNIKTVFSALVFKWGDRPHLSAQLLHTFLLKLWVVLHLVKESFLRDFFFFFNFVFVYLVFFLKIRSCAYTHSMFYEEGKLFLSWYWQQHYQCSVSWWQEGALLPGTTENCLCASTSAWPPLTWTSVEQLLL